MSSHVLCSVCHNQIWPLAEHEQWFGKRAEEEVTVTSKLLWHSVLTIGTRLPGCVTWTQLSLACVFRCVLRFFALVNVHVAGSVCLCVQRRVRARLGVYVGVGVSSEVDSEVRHGDKRQMHKNQWVETKIRSESWDTRKNRSKLKRLGLFISFTCN